MKKFYILLCFVLSAALSGAQWTPQAAGVLPAGYAITSISVVNATTAWVVANDLQLYQTHNAVGNQIRVLTTTNGGTSWITHTVVNDLLGVDISAIDANTAFVTTNDFGVDQSVYKTTNGGTSWTQLSPSPGAGSGSIVRHFNANDMILFNNGSSKISNNGGMTWNAPTGPPAFLGVESLVFDNAHNGFATLGNRAWFGTNQHRIFRTSDKGNTWQVISILSFPVNAVIQTIAFVDSAHGLAVSSLLYPNYNYDVSSHAAKSSNGGGVWIAAPNPPVLLSNICAVPGTTNSYVGVAGGTGTSPATAITNDGGATWYVANSSTALACVAFASPNAGWAANATAASGNSPAIYKWSGGPVSISENTVSNELSVFPTPADDYINITAKNSKLWMDAQVIIYDETGRQCFASSQFNSGQKIDISQLENGIYFIQVFSDERTATLKFIHTNQ